VTDVALDDTDRAIINAFQGGFPLVKRPFEPAAQALQSQGIDIGGSELHSRIVALEEAGVLSRFGALLNAEEIGGTATLVAMHAPEDRFEEIAELVNAHTAVAHNYERTHPELNMWFVLSVVDESRVDDVLAEIEAETGQTTYNLPKLTEFHVGAKFSLDGPIDDGTVDLSGLGGVPTPTDRSDLSPAERDLVYEIQGGLPATQQPFDAVSDAVEKDTEWVCETLRRFLAEGKIRRVGVVPNHYELGYEENAMTVWDVPDDQVQPAGEAVAAFDFVTHCYERPRHDGVWPYNVFAMVHGRDEAECAERIDAVDQTMREFWDPAEEDHDLLYSTQILKKTGIRLDERADANTSAASDTDEETASGDVASPR